MILQLINAPEFHLHFALHTFSILPCLILPTLPKISIVQHTQEQMNQCLI